jgi:hypothetical protein
LPLMFPADRVHVAASACPAGRGGNFSCLEGRTVGPHCGTIGEKTQTTHPGSPGCCSDHRGGCGAHYIFAQNAEHLCRGRAFLCRARSSCRDGHQCRTLSAVQSKRKAQISADGIPRDGGPDPARAFCRCLCRGGASRRAAAYIGQKRIVLRFREAFPNVPGKGKVRWLSTTMNHEKLSTSRPAGI